MTENPSPQPPPPQGEGESALFPLPPAGGEGLQPPSPAPPLRAADPGEAPPTGPAGGQQGAGAFGRRRSVRLAAVVVLGAGAAFAAWYLLVRPPEPRNDLERFGGEWKLTDARQGQREDEDAVRVGVRVTGDRFQFVAAGRDGKAYRIVLHEAAAPKQIDLDMLDTGRLVGAPVSMHGVYAFDGNARVRLRLRDRSEPRPKTLDDPDATDWVLTKVSLQPADAPKR